MKNQKGLATIWIIIIVIIAVIFGAIGGYYYLKNQEKETPAVIPTQTVSAQTTLSTTAPSVTTTPTNETSNWKTYTNNEFGYSLKYPQDYKISDQCYDSKTSKKIDYELMPKWLVIISKNMDDKFPYCESDFNAMDLIVRGNKSEININEMMEQSDTDIESEVTINGIKWAKQIMTQPSDFDGSYTTEYYTNHNGRGYTLSTKNTDSAGNHGATVDKIMKTFQFIY